MSVDHYENFPVASWLCPPGLRPAVRAIYLFARTADDLADEGDVAPDTRLQDLAHYRRDLMAVLSGIEPSVRWRHVFVPLRDVTRTRGLPAQLFCDLLSAFEQDVVQHHYKDRPALLDYCRLSANPVGRLMLHLHGLNSTPHLDASDAICSALQLANFWQDLGVDTARGRLYIPETDCRRHGVRPQDLLRGDGGPHVPALVADVASWTRELMLSGTSLVHALPGRVGWELRLVVQGGLRILDKIQDLNFETLTQRPTLGPSDLPRMAWRAWRMRTPAVAAMTRTP